MSSVRIVVDRVAIHFGYADAGTLQYWHFILGIAVELLAALELRQDWRLSDAELARRSGR